jgi:hypothetical protein
MDNNKNRMKDRPKSHAELRKMFFQHGSEIGIVDTDKIGNTEAKLTKRSKLSHKKQHGDSNTTKQ